MIKELLLIKGKKGWLLRDFVIVGIIFGMIISLFLFSVASIAEKYNDDTMISADFQKHYSVLSQNLNKLDSANKAVQGGSNGQGLGLIGAFDVAFNSVFTVIVMVWDSIAIYTGMASNVSNDFPFLDGKVIILFLSGLIAILTAYLIFVWLSSVSRGKI